MVTKILAVAEKPSIAKAVAHHLAAGPVQVHNAPGLQFIKNYVFETTLHAAWGRCQVTMTSVSGHLTANDFPDTYRGWQSCSPAALFEASILTFIEPDKLPIEKNIQSKARAASVLYIWTDCDREGEHIGSEIRDVALKVKPGLQVKRAKFSNTEKAHIVNAAKNPVDLDERQANAVAARIELDLRIGAIFTRAQTNNLKSLILPVAPEIGAISYGSCQFPTLGFVVDRYFRVKNFVPEPFWKIQVFHVREGLRTAFAWRRVHLFDRMIVAILFERCIAARTAEVTKLQTKPTSKWKPLPLTTVELQKCGSRFLHMNSQKTMTVAETLYQRGFISYPRTETDQFDRGMDLRAVVALQADDDRWGVYAQGLLDGAFRAPRAGRGNDQAHPPIHPVGRAAAGGALSADERRVYEFVVRRFLACCSEDAKGTATTVELAYGEETFTATGLTVLERNYLDVYPYDRWTSSQQLPAFTLGETFVPTEARMAAGETCPPALLTEPELIALMDANGIGTDATMAEHISKIQQRDYCTVRPRAAAASRVGAAGAGARNGGDPDGGDDDDTTGSGRASGGGGGVLEFVPTTLGVALIRGYEDMGSAASLSRPYLRREMEEQMRGICEGRLGRREVVQASLERYREVYCRAAAHMDVLKNSVRKYVLDQDVS